MSMTKVNELVSENTTPAASSFLIPSELLPKNMDLRETARMLYRRVWLIAAVTLACSLLSFVIALALTPQYRAKTIVMIDSRQSRIFDMASVMSGLPAENTALRSEIDIITSLAVVNRVIDKLNLVEDSELRPQSLLGFLNLSRWFNTKAEIEDQKAYDRSLVAQSIGKRLKVENDGRSLSIAISFDSADPKKSALIANAFADEYLVDQLEAKYEATARANKWLDARLGTLREQVENAEKAVQEFRSKTNLIEIEGATVAARQMQDVNKQLMEARAQTSQAEARLRSAQNMLHSKGGVDGVADVLASPTIQNLRMQEADLRRRQADMASRYGELHPKMINARAEQRELQSKIGEEVRKVMQALENEVDVARAKEKQFEKDLKELERQAGTEMKDSVALRQLEREADANRTLYQDFLNRFKQTSEQANLQVADSRIIARATPPIVPNFPKKSLFILIGAIIGAALGVLLAYLVEYFDRGFRSASQLEEMAGLPVVGLVPSLVGVTGRAPEDYVVDKPLSAYSESLRTVRTAIHFSNVDNPPKIVMVTSSMPGEGKTIFSFSLARSLAKGGNKILLVDADLRRHRVAQVARLSNVKNGLAALLSGKKQFKDVVKKDPVVAGLDIIPSVGKTPNAQDLLGSQQMQKILREAAERYDLVIIDTPPILAVSDAAMVSRNVDTTLFLVRWATTPRETVAQALKRFHTFGCKTAGLVMTQVNTTEHAKYGEGYYHKNYSEYYAN